MTQRVAPNNLAIVSVTVASLVQALEVARLELGTNATLVFDADGTLWSGDVGVDLFSAVMERGAIRELAVPQLRAEAQAAGVDPKLPTADLARALLRANELGQYENARAFAMMAWVFAGYSEQEMLQFAEEVVLDVRLSERAFDYARTVIAWARSREIAVKICSASPRSIVEVGARIFGLSADDVIAVTPAVLDGVLAPELVPGPLPYAEGKVARLREHLPEAQLLGGFGDSLADLHFLQLCAVPVAVKPAAGLRKVVASTPRMLLIDGD